VQMTIHSDSIKNLPVLLVLFFLKKTLAIEEIIY
jgi:hypothetical protein